MYVRRLKAFEKMHLSVNLPRHYDMLYSRVMLEEKTKQNPSIIFKSFVYMFPKESREINTLVGIIGIG